MNAHKVDYVLGYELGAVSKVIDPLRGYDLCWAGMSAPPNNEDIAKHARAVMMGFAVMLTQSRLN